MASSSDPAMRLQLVPLAWTGSLAHVEASVSPVLSQPLPVSSPQTHLSALAFVLQWSGWSSPGLPAPVGKGNPQASAHRACHGWTVPVLGSFISVGASSSVGAGEPLPCLPRPCPGWRPDRGQPGFPVLLQLLQPLRGLLRACSPLSSCSCFCGPTSLPRPGLRADPTHHGRNCGTRSPAGMLAPARCLLPAVAQAYVAELCAHSPAS